MQRPPPIQIVPARGPGQDTGVPGQGGEPFAIHEPGGELLKQLLHPAVTVFDQMYRTLPDDGWYSPLVSPSRPVQFELGAYKVPSDVHLWMMNYEFAVFRQSGVDAGDFVRSEDERFSGVMGFDLTVDGRRPASLLFQLDPISVQTTRQQFEPIIGQSTPSRLSAVAQISGTVPAQFNRAAATAFASTANAGTSLLPARSRRQGAPAPAPYTVVVKGGQSVALGCVIFKTVPSPLAFVQGEITGYLLEANQSYALINRMRPR
jgi:hypothetical protein